LEQITQCKIIQGIITSGKINQYLTPMLDYVYWERLPRVRLHRIKLPKIELPRIKSLWVRLPRARLARIGIPMEILIKENI
jgi:hypothetical protein